MFQTQLHNRASAAFQRRKRAKAGIGAGLAPVGRTQVSIGFGSRRAWQNQFAGGIRMPGLLVRVTPSMFFDRREIQTALSVCQREGLLRATSRIREYAVQSIRRMGMAKPPMRIMTLHPGISPGQLASIPNLNGRTRRALIQRAWEIRTRPPSAPGSPPHTHVPHSHMLGFRRNLYYGYDRVRHVGVAGPDARGDSPTLPGLHEFGGRRRLRLYALQLQYPRAIPIVKWFPEDEVVFSHRWVDTGVHRTVVYPARPFMRPALEKAIRRGDVARALRGTFRSATVSGGFRP